MPADRPLSLGEPKRWRDVNDVPLGGVEIDGLIERKMIWESGLQDMGT